MLDTDSPTAGQGELKMSSGAHFVVWFAKGFKKCLKPQQYTRVLRRLIVRVCGRVRHRFSHRWAGGTQDVLRRSWCRVFYGGFKKVMKSDQQSRGFKGFGLKPQVCTGVLRIFKDIS